MADDKCVNVSNFNILYIKTWEKEITLCINFVFEEMNLEG